MNGIAEGRQESNQVLHKTCVQEVRRSDRIKAMRSSPPTPLAKIRPEMVEGKSDFAKHVNLSPDCLQSVWSNVLSHFIVVTGMSSKSQLNVLVVELCLQKEFVRSLCLF